jgi:hypothetical protein
MNKIVQDNPSNWSTLINELNDVRSSIEERTKVEGQMIVGARVSREVRGKIFKRRRRRRVNFVIKLDVYKLNIVIYIRPGYKFV